MAVLDVAYLKIYLWFLKQSVAFGIFMEEVVKHPSALAVIHLQTTLVLCTHLLLCNLMVALMAAILA